MSRSISSNQSKHNGTKRHPDDRRSSLAVAEQVPSSSSATILAKENKRPLITVMSEDHLSASSSKPQTTCTNPISSAQKQSFLSKFARSEVKLSKSIERATTSTTDDTARQKQSKSNDSDAHRLRKSNNEQSIEVEMKSAIPSNRPGTQCDRVPITSTTNTLGPKAGPSNRMLPSKAIKSFNQTQQYTSDINKTTVMEDTSMSYKDDGDDADDDNDQVLPSWPSRIDAAALKPSLVQHQVYSLKDYSQVAGPIESIPTSNTSVSGRLLKSMSQDRKVDSKTKRMSESILTSVGHAGLYPHDSKSVANSRLRNSPLVPAANLAMGPATSVNSLLPPGRNCNMLGESRIDRMRKLFVSPLSLRGSAGTSGSKSSHQASGSPRLSLQAGANMLNKPHHLMHAMYRNRVVIGSHHNRRSPMRQKQSKIKGFRVYGCPLGMANTMYPITCFGRPEIYKQQSVPYILVRLCNYIEESSLNLTHEGIFRVSGNARIMDKLKTLFDHLGDAPLESESVDVATSASMLKMYLRELPEPLIPTRMNYYFFMLAKKYSSYLSKNNPNGSRASDNLTNSGQNEVSSISDTQSSVDRQRMAFLRDLTKLIRKLPIDNYNVLRYLTCFLHRVALKQQSNKMSAEALGIVFGPNVFRIRSESYKGLKEQELSNQIMASLISNYKQIFDCDLTDPLGNLISSDDNLNLNSEHNLQLPSAIIGQSKSSDVGETSSTGEILTRNIAASSSVASTSADFSTAAKCVQQPRCPKHSYHGKYHYHSAGTSKMSNDDRLHDDCDEEDFGDEDDDDADIDELDEDDDCDDESFSPSSGSGSYCSYLASGSLDSIYDGDVEAEQYDDDDDDDDVMDSNTSSECASETSYTPSSSHSDSDANAAGVSSSNFSSTPSSIEANDDQDFDSNVANSLQGDKPCQVCKRRESAQIDAIKLREQIASLTLEESRATSPHHDDQLNESDVKLVKPDPLKPTSLKAKNRSSTRKRRSDDSRRARAVTKDDSDTTATKTSSDLALDRKSVSLNLRTDEKLTKFHHHQLRQAHKQSVLRRRSSSASSLMRITNRYSRASRKRSTGRDERHQRLRAHADRKRYNNPIGFSRKSRNKSHPLKKVENSSRVSQTYDQQTKASSSKSPTEWKKDDFYASELIAMDLPPEVRKDLVWNYVSSSFLETPECDHYFQLRSYNSDDVLFRAHDTDSELIDSSKNRRRFSGQDFLQTNNESVLVAARPQFSEIYESFECKDSMPFNEVDTRGLSRSAAAAVKSSVISLLSDPMTNFKNSELSLDDETDPIVQQLRVIKDFIRVLRKILTVCSSSNIDQKNFKNLTKSIGYIGSDAHSDDSTTFYVDHITDKSTFLALDNIKRDFTDDTQRIDDATQHKLEKLFSHTIANLKKRYNNLKYIREHYFKHHFKHPQTEDEFNIGRSGLKSGSEHHEFELNKQPELINCGGNPIVEASSDQELSIGSALNTPTYMVTKKHESTATTIDESGQLTEIQKKHDGIEPSSCKFGPLCPVEFVFNVEKQLASRRVSGLRLVKLDDMTPAQLQSEKLELQKNLLRYEHWFNRPTTRSEFNLVGHLYERYRAIKIIKQRKHVSSDSM